MLAADVPHPIHDRQGLEAVRLPAEAKDRISSRIERLAANPFPKDTPKPKGFADAYRVRVGKYRILYKLAWEEKAIVVFRIALRKKAY